MNHSPRYQRQTQLKKIGLAGQAKLQAAHVVIVGAGGLGSPVSLFLAGAGVGKLTLVDHDHVSLSNLHRQILFKEHDIDQPKASVAQQALSELNQTIEVTAITERLDADNVTSLIQQADVVVDAADNFVVSYLLSDACYQARIPLVAASVMDTQGYIGVFCGTADKPAPSLRAVFPKPSPASNDCNSVGVTGPSVGTIGSLQAQEVLKVIIGDDSQLLGKLLYLDLWDYRQQIIDFNQAEEPNKQGIGIISEQQLTSDDYIIDVRTTVEADEEPISLSSSLISNVSSIPLSELSEHTATLPKQQRLVCVCRSGQRALSACQALLEAGFTNTAVLTVKLPTVKQESVET